MPKTYTPETTHEFLCWGGPSGSVLARNVLIVTFGLEYTCEEIMHREGGGKDSQTFSRNDLLSLITGMRISEFHDNVVFNFQIFF